MLALLRPNPSNGLGLAFSTLKLSVWTLSQDSVTSPATCGVFRNSGSEFWGLNKAGGYGFYWSWYSKAFRSHFSAFLYLNCELPNNPFIYLSFDFFTFKPLASVWLCFGPKVWLATALRAVLRQWRSIMHGIQILDFRTINFLLLNLGFACLAFKLIF